MAKSGGIRAGKRVRIDGLTKATEHNGVGGTAVRQEGEKWLIKTETGQELLLKEENIHPDEPPKKRARFADEEGGEVEMVKVEDVKDEAEEVDEEDPPHTTWANNVVNIRLITGTGESAEVGSFNPSFTHQVFFTPGEGEEPRKHEELIIGYEEPRIEIVYAANTMKAGVDFAHSGMVGMKLLKEENLSRTNVLSSIEKRAPCDYATKLPAVADSAEQPFTPCGELVHEEPCKEGTLKMFHFIANQPAQVTFVQRLQTFAIWLIETGSAIEVPDDSWNVFTLYRVEQRGGADVHVLLGFLTAYSYWVYDKAENAIDKRRLRVSQCIVLPPFHRQGHASRLLKAAYRFALKDPSILDVSVEDPSPEFQAVRDATDSVLLHQDGCVDALAGAEPPLAEVGRKLKLCRQQMKRLAHIATFHKLGLHDPEGDPETQDPEVRKVRLKIKAALYKQALCEHKGVVHFDHQDEDEDPKEKAQNGASGGSQASKMAGAPEGKAAVGGEIGRISEEDVQEALQEKLSRVWGEGGDPYERKKSLRSMFGAVYKQYAAAAAKVKHAALGTK